MEGGAGGGLEPVLPALCLDRQHRQEDWSRMIRRREAPDEDEPDCHSSLNDWSTNQRGGYIWNIRLTRDSLLVGQGTDLWPDCHFVCSHAACRMQQQRVGDYFIDTGIF